MTSLLPSPLTSSDVDEAELADARGCAGLGRRRGRSRGNVDRLPVGMERPVAGAADRPGASSQPRGVRMSLRLSPFTSPAPMPWP